MHGNSVASKDPRNCLTGRWINHFLKQSTVCASKMASSRPPAHKPMTEEARRSLKQFIVVLAAALAIGPTMLYSIPAGIAKGVTLQRPTATITTTTTVTATVTSAKQTITVTTAATIPLRHPMEGRRFSNNEMILPVAEWTDANGATVCYNKILGEFVADCNAARIDNEAYDNKAGVVDWLFYLLGGFALGCMVIAYCAG